ncbi:hypothetical protein HXX76_008714 [Chlamydomonas incerta]|uniref:Uncharacterized protein n=1 Tax=Chlamydomonas incerta TaxID=51695 RepID=A0A835W1U4_CHLIN|nr:hypothetical protein HXX76_008714 [Chlamydomonas incerta]|eukprot:KAG2432986.1 hypothetical protein HXX76_008714 [Chlamydomonas incerta]
MFTLCSNPTLSPPIFSALCSTWRIASSLCSDDSDVVASVGGLCSGIRAAYTDDAQYKSCLQPYTGIRSTSGIRAGHLRACDDMAGEPMGGCDTCGSAASCPNPLVSYADGCIDMDMGQCVAWRGFCTAAEAAPNGAAAAVLCRRANNRAGIVAPPLPPSPPPPGLSPSPSPSPSPATTSSPSMHGGNTTAGGPSPPAAPCVVDGTLPECANFSYPHTSVLADISNLCTAMDYMPGCGISHACEAGLVSGDYCRPFTLLATICADMPGMAGCKSYRGLCKAGSLVPQCATRPAIPKTPFTKQAQSLIDTVCSATPAPALCDTCNQLGCPDYIGALAAACAAAPNTEGCAELYEGWCAAAAAWEGRGNALAADAIANSSLVYYCKPSAAYAALPSPAPAAASPSPAPSPSSVPSGSSPAPAAAACVWDPTRAECGAYVYPSTSVLADVTSLCKMMPYMPGCIIAGACVAGLASGDYCRPFTLLATICADMPGMAGCKSYKSMCLVPNSRVPQCSQLPAIPKTPSTRQAQDLMDSVCTSPAGAALPPCATCTATTCPDPLTPLTRVCANAAVASSAAGAGCAAYFEDWCAAASAWQAAGSGSLSHFCGDSKAYKAAQGFSPAPAASPKPAPSPTRTASKSPPPRRMAPPPRRAKVGKRQSAASL